MTVTVSELVLKVTLERREPRGEEQDGLYPKGPEMEVFSFLYTPVPPQDRTESSAYDLTISWEVWVVLGPSLPTGRGVGTVT